MTYRQRKGNDMAETLDELLGETPAAPSPEEKPEVPTRGSAQERIKELVAEKKAAEAKVLQLEEQLKTKPDPQVDPTVEPEKFVVDVIEKRYGSLFQKTEQVAQEAAMREVLGEHPEAKKFQDEIKQYGTTHKTLPWEDVVQLVLAKHGKDVVAPEESPALGGQPNPSSRRDETPAQKSLESLEAELNESFKKGELEL